MQLLFLLSFKPPRISSLLDDFDLSLPPMPSDRSSLGTQSVFFIKKRSICLDGLFTGVMRCFRSALPLSNYCWPSTLCWSETSSWESLLDMSPEYLLAGSTSFVFTSTSSSSIFILSTSSSLKQHSELQSEDDDRSSACSKLNADEPTGPFLWGTGDGWSLENEPLVTSWVEPCLLLPKKPDLEFWPHCLTPKALADPELMDE